MAAGRHPFIVNDPLPGRLRNATCNTDVQRPTCVPSGEPGYAHTHDHIEPGGSTVGAGLHPQRMGLVATAGEQSEGRGRRDRPAVVEVRFRPQGSGNGCPHQRCRAVRRRCSSGRRQAATRRRADPGWILLPTTYADHRFWSEVDDEDRAREVSQFLKNTAIFGGLVLVGTARSSGRSTAPLAAAPRGAAGLSCPFDEAASHRALSSFTQVPFDRWLELHPHVAWSAGRRFLTVRRGSS